MRLVIVFDNYKVDPCCEAAWGFSCFLPEKRLLFDTGSSGSVLTHNMACLGITPEDLDLILLSHFHWDHTGGLFDLLSQDPKKRVILHSAFSSHFAREALRLGASVEWIDEAREIAPGVFTTGRLEGPVPEAGLVVRGEQGLALITGCAHPGILNMARAAVSLFGQPLVLVLGGFHLLNQSKKVILQIIEGLKQLGVRYVAPSHCTGDKARAIFADLYEDGFISIGAGKVLEF